MLASRAEVSGREGGGGSCPPGAFEPDKSGLWTDLFSLDSVILIGYNDLPLFPIFIFEVDFSESHIS